MCIFLRGSQRARSGLVNDCCCIPVKYTLVVVLLETFLSRVLGGLLVTHHRLWWADWHCKAISALPYLFPTLCLSSRSLNKGSKSHGCLFPPPIVSTPSLGSNLTTVPYGNKWRGRRCLHGTMSPSLLFAYCFQDIDLNCTSSSLKPHKVVSPVVCHCTALSSTTTKSELWAIHRQLRDFHLLRKKELNMNSICCFLFCKNCLFNPMHNRSKVDPDLIFCHLPFATLVACRVRTIWATQQRKQSYDFTLRPLHLSGKCWFDIHLQSDSKLDSPFAYSKAFHRLASKNSSLMASCADVL
jgi:hypothetical protein